MYFTLLKRIKYRKNRYCLFLYVNQIYFDMSHISFLKYFLNITHYTIMLLSFQLFRSPLSFRSSFFVHPFGEVDKSRIIRHYYFQFLNEDTEVLWNHEVTIQDYQTSSWSRATATVQPSIAQDLNFSPLTVLAVDSCFIICLQNSHFQELNKTISFAWFPKLLIVSLFSVHLVDNKSIHLKTRRIQCSAVVCYTHVHFPCIFFERNTVKSIVQLAGVISLW